MGVFTPFLIYTIEDYKPHLRFVIFKGIAHEIYIRTLKGADINFVGNSLKDYKPQVRFVIFNGINVQRCKGCRRTMCPPYFS